MKKAFLADVVQKHGRKIIQYGQQLPGEFDADAIHDLRVEYKKLRAFVRLLHAAGKDASDLAVPASLRSLYQAAGKVRDLQLFQQQIIDHAAQRAILLPVMLQQVSRQLFRAKERLVEVWEDCKARKTLSQLKQELPRKLNTDTIHTFMHRKVASIQFLLMALEKDKELHSIRKQLKDILLNIRIFNKEWGIAFPVVAWSNEKQLEETAELLGGYNDVCSMLSRLNDPLLQTLPPSEAEHVQQWKTTMLQEKDIFRNKVVDHVHQLQLISNFETRSEDNLIV